MAFEPRIARLRSLEFAALQTRSRRGRYLDAVAREDAQRIGAGGAVGDGGATADDLWRIAGYVADEQRDHLRRRAHCGQPAALDRGEMLAHAVHLVDRRPALEQGLVDSLLLF